MAEYYSPPAVPRSVFKTEAYKIPGECLEHFDDGKWFSFSGEGGDPILTEDAVGWLTSDRFLLEGLGTTRRAYIMLEFEYAVPKSTWVYFEIPLVLGPNPLAGGLGPSVSVAYNHGSHEFITRLYQIFRTHTQGEVIPIVYSCKIPTPFTGLVLAKHPHGKAKSWCETCGVASNSKLECTCV